MSQGPTPSDDRPDPQVRIATGGAALRADRLVIASIAAHVAEDTSNECGGVLVGAIEPDGTLLITSSIRAEHALSRPSSLTFTHETWNYINETLERDHPDLRIVGWYHSHPGFSVFLSEYDTFIHRNFFSARWQVAYVVDPLLHEDGFFGWDDGEIVRFPEWGIRAVSDRTESAINEPAQRRAVSAPPAGRSIMSLIAFGVGGLLVGVIGGLILARDSPGSPPLLTGAATVRVDGVVITRELTIDQGCLRVTMSVINPTNTDLTSVQIVDPVPASLLGAKACTNDSKVPAEVVAVIPQLTSHQTKALSYAIRIPKESPGGVEALNAWDVEHSGLVHQLQAKPPVLEAHDLELAVGDSSPLPIGDRYGDGSSIPGKLPDGWTIQPATIVQVDGNVVHAVEPGEAHIVDAKKHTVSKIQVRQAVPVSQPSTTIPGAVTTTTG